jgi:LPXTG-motif cell wall-anchored protein
MRGRRLAGAAGLGCAGLMVVAMVAFVPPASAGPKATAGQACGASDCGSQGASCGSPDCGSPDYGNAGYGDGGGQGANADGPAADCQDAIENTPPGGSGGLKLTANVREGANVAPGDDITVRLTWDPKQWSGKDLDMALACVRVKGGLDPHLSREERPAANDGVFEYRLHVPNNIKPGCDICVQGFLAGMAGDGGPQQVGSNPECFMSGPPPPAPPPAPPVTRPPAPATTTTTAAPPRTPAEVPAEVAGTNTSLPGTPAPGPAVAPAGELPRTGASATRIGTAGGGATLALGGLSLIGGTRRRNRHRPGI